MLVPWQRVRPRHPCIHHSMPHLPPTHLHRKPSPRQRCHTLPKASHLPEPLLDHAHLPMRMALPRLMVTLNILVRAPTRERPTGRMGTCSRPSGPHRPLGRVMAIQRLLPIRNPPIQRKRRTQTNTGLARASRVMLDLHNLLNNRHSPVINIIIPTRTTVHMGITTDTMARQVRRPVEEEETGRIIMVRWRGVITVESHRLEHRGMATPVE